MNKKVKPYINIGPGSIINRNLEELGWSQKDLSEVLGMAHNIVNEIIQHKRKITVDIARKLAKAFDSSPEFWMNLEVKYRLNSELDKNEEEKLAATEIKAHIRKYMPVSEMAKRGWIDKSKSLESLIATYKGFWRIKKLDFSFYEGQSPSFYARKSKFDAEFTKNYSITWLQMAYRCSQIIHRKHKKYDEQKLKHLLKALPDYTLMGDGPEKFINSLYEAGVQFFVLSHLPKTYLDGASYQYKKKRYIIYTKRHDRVDNFWFTMAHEMAHHLKHIKTDDDCFLDNLEDIAENNKEKEADQVAADSLKTKAILKLSEPYKNYLTQDRLDEVSHKTGVGKPVVLGILQHYDYIDYRKLNNNKKKISEYIPKEYVMG